MQASSRKAEGDALDADFGGRQIGFLPCAAGACTPISSKARRMVEQTNAVKAFELVYILVGYMGTMAGVVLSILFIAYHGEKFGDKVI